VVVLIVVPTALILGLRHLDQAGLQSWLMQHPQQVATSGLPLRPWAMISVIGGWIVGWSGIGAWRMMTRDA
jgi:hypothetical protein